MNTGVTIYFNGIGYYFEDYEELSDLLDMECDTIVPSNGTDNEIVFDE